MNFFSPNWSNLDRHYSEQLSNLKAILEEKKTSLFCFSFFFFSRIDCWFFWYTICSLVNIMQNCLARMGNYCTSFISISRNLSSKSPQIHIMLCQFCNSVRFEISKISYNSSKFVISKNSDRFCKILQCSIWSSFDHCCLSVFLFVKVGLLVN